MLKISSCLKIKIYSVLVQTNDASFKNVGSMSNPICICSSTILITSSLNYLETFWVIIMTWMEIQTSYHCEIDTLLQEFLINTKRWLWLLITFWMKPFILVLTKCILTPKELLCTIWLSLLCFNLFFIIGN